MPRLYLLQGPTYLKNLRLQKFQATFAMGLYNGGGGANAATFVFNGTDRDNYDAVQLFAGTSSCTPSGFECEGGYPGWPMSGTYSAGPAAPDYGWMWFRVQFDGTTLQVWQILGTTTAPTDWTSATLVVSATGCHTTGGRIGFANNFSGIPTNVNYLTIKSWDASTSAFDITEATDTFTIDGSGNGNNTLASDYNGNQTFDGSQFYTYDGWNRLMTVSHGYRDTSGNLQHGQASVTNSYDAKGRRIIKVVNNTGSWDCTYNYYYNGNQQIEQQNGSNETIRQNVWGLGYIDNLIQTSLNSSPTTQVTCDTPYWVLQDANYNVLGILNSSGVLVERYEYSAYGQRTVYFSPGSNDPFCMAPTVASQRFVASTGTEAYGLCEFGHQGLMHDEECGLVYARHRYLQPATGRWLQRDELGYFDGQDLYTCFKDNPIRRKDPYGLSDSVSDALLEAIAEGNVEEIKTLLWAAQNELTGEEIEIAEQFLAKVAKCEAIHAAYDALNCSSCTKCATRAQIDSAIKCRTLEIALRSQYLWMNCDSCLAGSIARGSAIAKAGHETQLAQKTAALAACFAFRKLLP